MRASHGCGRSELTAARSYVLQHETGRFGYLGILSSTWCREHIKKVELRPGMAEAYVHDPHKPAFSARARGSGLREWGFASSVTCATFSRSAAPLRRGCFAHRRREFAEQRSFIGETHVEVPFDFSTIAELDRGYP